jgi:FMN phosphatase YigB (HAD superfamily)
VCGVHAAEVAYVGDRVDNDVVPAVEAGLFAVLVRRGPWGYIHESLPEAKLAHLRLDDLSALPSALQAHNERVVTATDSARTKG